MTLKEDLQEIRGIGEAKADAILDVVGDVESDVDVDKLWYYLERGNVKAAKSVLKDG